MKYVKILGLLAVAAAALMAFAGTASASLTSPTGITLKKGAKIHAVSENGHVKFKSANLPIIECESTFEGEVSADGGTSGPILSLTFGPCTDSWHVTTVTNGTWSIASTGSYNGTLSFTGLKVAETRFGITCVLVFNSTHIGPVTGGNPATVKIEAIIPIYAPESSPLCGTVLAWTGSYKTTESLYVV